MKTIDLTDNQVAEMTASIRKIMDYIYDREYDFIDRFCKFDGAFTITEVFVGDYAIKFVYVLTSGQHIADQIRIDDFLRWARE